MGRKEYLNKNKEIYIRVYLKSISYLPSVKKQRSLQKNLTLS